jgi:hypothetical protein
VIAEAQVVATPTPLLTSDLFITRPVSLFHHIWPVAALATAMMVNLAWMGFLGYGLFKLVKPELF